MMVFRRIIQDFKCFILLARFNHEQILLGLIRLLILLAVRYLYSIHRYLREQSSRLLLQSAEEYIQLN